MWGYNAKTSVGKRLFGNSKLKSEDFAKQAEQALQEQNFNKAIKYYNQALEIYPGHTPSVAGKFKAHFELAKSTQLPKIALNNLKEAHILQSDNLEVIQLLANARQADYNRRHSTQTNLKESIDTDEKVLASKPTFQFENLIFQGGGIKGIAYLGALTGIDLSPIKRLGGASAGAITAALLGMGYSLKECETLLKKVDFKLFMDGEFRKELLHLLSDEELKKLEVFGLQLRKDIGKVRASMEGGSSHPSTLASGSVAIVKLLQTKNSEYVSILKKLLGLLNEDKYFGLFQGAYFRLDWAEGLIQQKTGIAYITFKEFKELSATYSEFKDIYFVGVNLNTGLTQVFSHEHTPNDIISDALRISMSIPIIFKAHQRYIKNDKGERVPHPDGYLFVDGGMLDNFPLWLFDNAKYFINPACDHIQENPYTLGFRLTNADAIQALQQGTVVANENPQDLISYLFQLIKVIYQKQESDHAKSQEASRTVYIDHLGVNTIQFDLTQDQEQALVESGIKAIQDYFKNRIVEDPKKQLKKAVKQGNLRTVIRLMADINREDAEANLAQLVTIAKTNQDEAMKTLLELFQVHYHSEATDRTSATIGSAEKIGFFYHSSSHIPIWFKDEDEEKEEEGSDNDFDGGNNTNLPSNVLSSNFRSLNRS